MRLVLCLLKANLIFIHKICLPIILLLNYTFILILLFLFAYRKVKHSNFLPLLQFLFLILSFSFEFYLMFVKFFLWFIIFNEFLFIKVLRPHIYNWAIIEILWDLHIVIILLIFTILVLQHFSLALNVMMISA